MNLSAAVMLVNKDIRPVRVVYDPDNVAKSYNPSQLYKTLDPTIKKDDLVIVPTRTRHGFTIAKVTEVGFAVDFNNPAEWGWIAGKFDEETYNNVLETEKKIVGRVAEAQENKMRDELRQAMGLGSVSFSDLDIMAAAAPPVTIAGRTSGPEEEVPLPEAPPEEPTPFEEFD